MQIIAVQLDSAWEDPAANCAKVSQLLHAQPPMPGALVALPEMFASGFSMDVPAATDNHQHTIESIKWLCRHFGIYIVAGIAVAGRDKKGQNQAIAIDPDGEILGAYTKLHPFSLGGETTHYESGTHLVTFGCGEFVAAPFVCYDLRFPEIFRQAAVHQGVNFFVVLANWPISRTEHWLTLLRARAIENQSWVLGCNRCGRDPATLYGGRSILVDPMGVIRADAGDSEGLLIADADLDTVAQTRSRLPFLQDTRNEFLPAKP